MQENLKNLANKLTPKQLKFSNLFCGGMDASEAYVSAGYSCNNKKTNASKAASNLLRQNQKVIKYVSALKEFKNRSINITRAMQIQVLTKARDIAVEQRNVSGIVAAVREQNEMLGFHRDTSPNPEREREKRELMDREILELRRLAKARTDELSWQLKQQPEQLKPVKDRRTDE